MSATKAVTARRVSHARRMGLRSIFGLVVAIAGASPALVSAQINVLAPTFSNLNGAAVWGSFGTAAGPSADRDQRPIWREGFAAFYGPFGGRGDTVVTFTETVSDSSEATIVEGSGEKVHRRVHETRQRRGDSKRLGNGKVTLVVGYQHSAFYRFGSPLFERTIPVGGIFVGSLLGPYRVPLASKKLAWYAGVAGTVVRLNDIGVRADTVEAVFSTERTLAPEAMITFMYTIAPTYRMILGASYQYLRFGSINYHAVQPGQNIDAATLATLPETLELQSVHLNLGLSFTASGLIPGR